MGSVNIRHKILKYVTERPGQVVYLNDIVDGIDVGEKSVQGTLNKMTKEHAIELQVMARGHAWRWMPKPQAQIAPQPTIEIKPMELESPRPKKKIDVNPDTRLSSKEREAWACIKQINRVFTTKEISKSMGEINSSYISTILTRLTQRGMIVKVGTGTYDIPGRQEVTLQPQSKATAIFEQIDVLGSGGLLLRRDDGVLFRATEITK